MRVTIACPEGHIADANQLARCIGLGPDDDRTYGEATWQDAGGNRYAVASAIVGPMFGAAATSPLTEPDWGCDIAAAARAQALIRIMQPAAPGIIAAVFGDDPAAPGIIAAVFGDDVAAALAVLGVTNG